MGSDKRVLIKAGIALYICMSGMDRFVCHIPNAVYIPAGIVAIALILIGFFRDRSSQ